MEKISEIGYRWVPGTEKISEVGYRRGFWVQMGTRNRPEKFSGYRWVLGTGQIFHDAG